MSSLSKAQKRKNKKKYFMSSKKSKSSGLDTGMKGFLVTCNDERQCVREAYNLLNEFADEIYGPEFKETAYKPDDNYVDIDEEFSKEMAAMKAQSQRRFQQIFTKVKGVIFINTTIPDPVLLVNKIFETVINTGKRRTRFILKLKPVVMTCKAYESDIRKALDDIFTPYSDEAKNRDLKYKVESKITQNDKITSSHVIWYVRESVNSIVPKWSACILEPDLMISFYILRTVCCISILDKYEEFKKYNLSNAAAENSECNLAKESVERTVVSETKDQCTEVIVSENASSVQKDQCTEVIVSENASSVQTNQKQSEDSS